MNTTPILTKYINYTISIVIGSFLLIASLIIDTSLISLVAEFIT